MNPSNYCFRTLGFCASVAVLAGCGGSQLPLGSPGAIADSAATSAVHRMSASSYKLLYSFHSRSDGAYPYAGLINVNGTLYGTTSSGGTKDNCFGIGRYCGTVFSVTTSGVENVVYRFGGGADGGDPSGSLTNVNDMLYGATTYGGANGFGVIFSVATSGAEKVVYSFGGGSDGAYPSGNLTYVNGTLYGTTTDGGGSGCSGYGCGTVFSVTTSGTEKVLYRFKGGTDGREPNDGMANLKGTLYGTTYIGGGSGCFVSLGCGTVFSVTTAGTEKVVHKFGRGSDGRNPEAGLINVKGVLYGTTTFGGGSDYDGTVFSVTRNGDEKVLHRFKFGSSDGDGPGSSLINVNGTLYGTTIEGGVKSNSGTVYSVTTTGTEKVVYSFGGGSDGALPYDSLNDLNGTLYGTTYEGGGRRCLHDAGCGTVFALTP